MSKSSPLIHDVAAQLFSPRYTRNREAYARLKEQADGVPLHTYRSDRPEFKEVTPLAFIVLQAILSATPRRVGRLGAALQALASPDVTAGPAHLTEQGVLMASCFADLGSGTPEREIMHTWRRKVGQHLAHMGVDWESAWRDAAQSFRTAHHMQLTLHSEWHLPDALKRWDLNMAGGLASQAQATRPPPYELQDPPTAGCLRLMDTWWTQATGWSEFPVDRLPRLATTTAHPQALFATLVDRLEQWSAPEVSRMASIAEVGPALVATFEHLEKRGPIVTLAVLDRLTGVEDSFFTAWCRQRQAALTPVPTATRRRLRS